MNTLGFGLIVKNESKIILRCLSSFYIFADSITVCDTGSTDNTVELIKNFCESKEIKYEIIKSEWKNFSINRSELIEKAKSKTDYTFLIDADEIFIAKGFDKSEIIKDAYYVKYIGNLEYSQVHLISNKYKFEYKGITHEYIFSPNAKDYETTEKIKLFHLHDGENRTEKFERDIQLLEQGIKEEPENSRYYFYLANSYRDIGNNDKAIEFYKKRAKLGGWGEEIYMSLFQMGVCHERKGNIKDAVFAYLTAWEIRPTRAESLFYLIKLYEKTKAENLKKLIKSQWEKIEYPKNDKLFIEKSCYIKG